MVGTDSKLPIKHILSDLPGFEAIEKITRLTKGFTSGEKFIVATGDSPFFVRTGSIDRYEIYRAEAEMLRTCHHNRIPCPEPVAIGVTADGTTCYSVLTYLSGQTADEMLHTLTEEEHARLGIESGQLLRRIHAIEPSDDVPDLQTDHQKRHEHWADQLEKTGVTFPGQSQVERYIERQLDCLQDVETRFQHSDYHPGHLVVRDGQLAGVIDFDRTEWNDPFRDFQRLPWFTCPASLTLARAQVKGYFHEGVPTSFWPRYNLYIALTLHRGAWAAHVKRPHNAHLLMRRIEEIVNTHDFVHGGSPVWFHQDVDLLREIPSS